MKRSNALLFTVLMMVILGLIAAGCSSKGDKPAAGIKDEDAIKAITTTVEGNTKGYKLSSPIVILERGTKTPGGESPFKVEYTITLADGSTKKETITYNVSPGGVNDMGVPVFNATEAK